MTVCTEMSNAMYCIALLYKISIYTVPEVKWDDDVEISIPEGDDRRICFSSDIGTASPYDVVVGVRGKGDPPATSGKQNVSNRKKKLYSNIRNVNYR